MSGTMIRIDPNGTITTRGWEKRGPPDWKTLRDLVGGYIERVKVKYEGRTRWAFVSENGVAEGLRFNPHATYLLHSMYGNTQLVGPCVIWVPDRKEQVR